MKDVGPELASLPRNRGELFMGLLGKKKKKKVRLKGRAVWVLEDALGRRSGSFLGRDSPEPTKLTGISSLE